MGFDLDSPHIPRHILMIRARRLVLKIRTDLREAISRLNILGRLAGEAGKIARRSASGNIEIQSSLYLYYQESKLILIEIGHVVH